MGFYASRRQLLCTCAAAGLATAGGCSVLDDGAASRTCGNDAPPSDAPTSRWGSRYAGPDNTATTPDGDGPAPSDTSQRADPIFVTKGHVGRPVVAGDTAYLTAGTTLYAVDASDGTVRWQVDHDRTALSPTLANGYLLVPTRKEEPQRQLATLYARSTSSGCAYWRADIDAWAHTLSADGMRCYVSSGDGAIVAVRLADGEVDWRARVGGHCSPVGIGQRRLYCASGSRLVALDSATGDPHWSVAFDAWFSPLTWPVVGDDAIYVRGTDDRVAAFDPTDGSVLWRTPDSFSVTAHPAVTSETIFVSTNSGALVAFSTDDGETERWRMESSRSLDAPIVGGSTIYVEEYTEKEGKEGSIVRDDEDLVAVDRRRGERGVQTTADGPGFYVATPLGVYFTRTSGGTSSLRRWRSAADSST